MIYEKIQESERLETVVLSSLLISGNCFSSLSRISLVALGGIAGNNSGLNFKSPEGFHLAFPDAGEGLRAFV